MSVVLDEELTGIINGALAARAPMIVASVDAEGRPRLTFRGSVQVFGPDQVSFWARNAEGATMDNIAANPHVALLLRNSETRVMLQMSGRGRVAEGADRDRAYDSAPELERNADPDRKGAGVVIDLDKVEGFLGFGPHGERRMVRMERD